MRLLRDLRGPLEPGESADDRTRAIWERQSNAYALYLFALWIPVGLVAWLVWWVLGKVTP